ncbi:uncharacterized protein LOC120837419, partial [Ixodes scapularis]|uniref:uncharacterized protein LOC120837419 n=1 Tax=Ixodes scapularis TaxID=6945 RepID=UPI001A9FC55F
PCFTVAGLQGRSSSGCCGASRRFPHQISRCVEVGGTSLPAALVNGNKLSFISRGRAPHGCSCSGCCNEGRLLKFPDQIPLSVWGGGISSGTPWAKECCAAEKQKGTHCKLCAEKGSWSTARYIESMLDRYRGMIDYSISHVR